jgi:hypothetical protein
LALAASVVERGFLGDGFPPVDAWLNLARGGAVWPAFGAALLLLLLWSMLAREARGSGGVTAAFAACLSLLAATVPVQLILARYSVELPGALMLGFVVVALALRVGARRGDEQPEVVFNLYIAGILPALAAYMLAWNPVQGSAALAISLTAACFIAAITWRFRARGAPAPRV